MFSFSKLIVSLVNIDNQVTFFTILVKKVTYIKTACQLYFFNKMQSKHTKHYQNYKKNKIICYR